MLPPAVKPAPRFSRSGGDKSLLPGPGGAWAGHLLVAFFSLTRETQASGVFGRMEEGVSGRQLPDGGGLILGIKKGGCLNTGSPKIL